MRYAIFAAALLYAWQAGAAYVVESYAGAAIAADFAPIVAALHH